MRKATKTDKGPKPAGPYSQAITHGDFIYVSGQGPIDPKTGELKKGDVKAETELIFSNIKAILEAAGSSLDHAIKLNVYLKDINDFAAMNEVYAKQFSDPPPARTTIQAGALPMGISVEIECIAARK